MQFSEKFSQIVFTVFFKHMQIYENIFFRAMSIV